MRANSRSASDCIGATRGAGMGDGAAGATTDHGDWRSSGPAAGAIRALRSGTDRADKRTDDRADDSADDMAEGDGDGADPDPSDRAGLNGARCICTSVRCRPSWMIAAMLSLASDPAALGAAR